MKEKLISVFNYLFEIAPGPQMKFYIPLAILIGLLILGAIAFYFIYKTKKKEDFAFKRLFKNTSKNLLFLGALILVLLLIRSENIMYLSMRFWLYLTLLFTAFFLYKLGKTFLVKYPIERENSKKPITPAMKNMPVYTTKKKK